MVDFVREGSQTRGGPVQDPVVILQQSSPEGGGSLHLGTSGTEVVGSTVSAIPLLLRGRRLRSFYGGSDMAGTYPHTLGAGTNEHSGPAGPAQSPSTLPFETHVSNLAASHVRRSRLLSWYVLI